MLSGFLPILSWLLLSLPQYITKHSSLEYGFHKNLRVSNSKSVLSAQNPVKLPQNPVELHQNPVELPQNPVELLENPV